MKLENNVPLLSVKVDDEVGENIVSHLVATIAHMYFSRNSHSYRQQTKEKKYRQMDDGAHRFIFVKN